MRVTMLQSPFSKLALAALLASLTAACGDKPANTGGASPSLSASAATTAAPVASTTDTATPPATSEKTKDEAHRLVIAATGCWFGGLWSDAEGDQGTEEKRAATEARCRDVAKRAYGSDDKTRVEQLRALDVKAVADLASKVEVLAATDSVDAAHKDNLVKLTSAIADAQRELMHARRAAERVRHDEDVKDHDKLSKDETDAVAPMRAHAAMESLLKLDVGDLTKEAHAIGVLCVMDRVNMARGLPRHLKMYAWGDALQLLFGVPLPSMPDDVTKRVAPTQLLAYMTDVAKAASHPVPDKIASGKDAKAKYSLAYAGMLEGISDRLKADGDGISRETELNRVVIVVHNRLAAEWRAEQAAYATDAPAKPTKPAKPKSK